VQPLNFQPIPYQGSKRRLAPRICKLFPRKIKTLYEPFAGSAAITIYAASHNLAQHFVIGDILPELVDLWRLIIDHPKEASSRYRALWTEQFKVGNDHFNITRSAYNTDKDPISLLYLIARCVKNAVRFNKNGAFTQSVDKRRTGVHPDKLERSIHTASSLLKGRSSLYSGDFKFCTASAQTGDLVYMDPPYQGTTYGHDKRYAAQLEREHLEEALRGLNERHVPFILSYDGKTGNKVYAEPLQDDLCTTHLSIHAGRSSQATLAGRAEDTVESLYISKSLTNHLEDLPDYSQPIRRQKQIELFAY
jgi:DNA adenine methylase